MCGFYRNKISPAPPGSPHGRATGLTHPENLPCYAATPYVRTDWFDVPDSIHDFRAFFSCEYVLNIEPFGRAMPICACVIFAALAISVISSLSGTTIGVILD